MVLTTLPDSVRSGLMELDRSLETVETPMVLVDADVADANLVRWQANCQRLGIANRPHVKTHRSIAWALRQIEIGAQGVTVQTVGEGEVMADAGIDDILLTTNTLGAAKLARLGQLARRCRLTVVADSDAVVEAVASAADAADARISVLVECDTGSKRCGIVSPLSIAELAARIATTPRLHFGGLMTYPPAGNREASALALTAAVAACRKAGLEPATVSSGGSPDMWREEGLEPLTEYRAGTYIYNDRSLMACGAATLEQCAMTVLATVVSRPAPDRAILDAGSKALTSDLLGLDGHGRILEFPQAVIYQLNEEHGLVDVSRCDTKPKVGDRVRIVPNHTCVVSNLFDRIGIISQGQLVGALRVDARGRSN